jgi:hypothetical protein
MDYLYPLSQKTSRWLKGTRILWVYVQISGHWNPETPDSEQFTDGKWLPGDSRYISRYYRHLCPDIPNQDPDTPCLTGNFIRSLFKVVSLILIVFVDSFEHNYHINTYRSKSLLIVRRFYTQFQNKIYSSSKFETPLFISFLRGHAS